MEKKNDHNEEQNHTPYMPIGMCLGMSIGMAIGSAMGNISMGTCIGVSVGMCIGVVLDSRNKKKTDDDSMPEETEE